MIWILRNISVHLWLITLFAIPLNFYILPGFMGYFPGINPLMTASVTLIFIAVIISIVMDLTARKIISGLIKEGQTWERSGISNRAEKNYIKALRIYDTFLLWPFYAKKTAGKISGAIAKFNLNTSGQNLVGEKLNFKLTASVYLKMNPADKDIAQLWLTRLRQSKIVTSFEQDILSMLAEKYYDDKVLSILIFDIFLGLEREDFIAKKLYKHILQDPELKDRYKAKMETLVGKEEETLHQQVSFLLPPKKPVRKPVQKSTIQIGKKIKQIIEKSILFLKSILVFIGSILSFLILSMGTIYVFIKEHEKTRFYLKAGFLLIVSAGLLFFMFNTMSHIFKSKPAEKEKIEITIQVSKPFTIQVAAYLKLKHAQSYVDVLKGKKVDAMVKKVDGGGKTWFVVRVSEFIDKQSAADYGKNLKEQKIIDDFFVNNK